MMETFLEDAEYSLHHRTNTLDDVSEGSESSEESDDPLDDPFLYDKFLPDPDWSLKNRLEEEEAKSKNLVDPGPFRYNRRVFVSCLPGALVIFALGGESLVFLVAVGTAVITTMAQLGDSRRCVVIFMLFFIPSHVYVLSTVIPLMWLSGWHLLSVIAINMFIILTAGWIIIQFKPFRTEEPNLAALIELALFTLYPLLSSGLFCWSLASVMKPSLIPVIFSFLWFVQLQIYLIPTVSSFRSQKCDASGGSVSGVVEENFDVLQVPMVILTVIAFVFVGPFLYVFITVMLSTMTVLSFKTLLHLVFMLSLTLFLSSLLSIRQIYEYLSLSYTVFIGVRWSGGVLCTLLCYSVLRDYGLDSHFLPLLPVAIGMFAALGVVLSMRRRKIIMAVLTTVLVSSLIALFLVWIQSMPHNLQHYLLGYLPLNVLYLVMCANFLLCLICLGMVSVDATPAFGSMMCLQAVVLTVCEVSLHNSGLYSTSLIQLSSISALYAIHRLQIAEKMTRPTAILSSSIHLAKSVAGASSLVLDKTRGEITTLEMCALAVLMYAFISVFIYGTSSEKSAIEVFQQLFFLLCGLAVSAHHLLLPVSMFLFQGSHSYTYVLGLWCVVGGALTLLYSQTVATGVKVHVLKVALALGVLGSAVILLHPRLAFTFYSLFQWLEMLNYVTLAAVFSSQLPLSPQHSVLLSLPLAVCPAIRMCFTLWSHLWLPQVILITLDVSAIFILVLVCMTIPELTEDAEKVIKYSILVACLSCFTLVGMDLMLWRKSLDNLSLASFLPLSVWDCPAWRAIVVIGLVIAVTLKIVHSVKGPFKLPLTLTPEDKTIRLTLPVIANGITLVTFFVTCTQGPSDPFLHDLWCCMSAVILSCLHGDEVFLPQLSGEKQAAPIVVTSTVSLVLASLFRSRFWHFSSILTTIGGFLEITFLLTTSLIYLVLWSILWKGQAWSEPAVVFLMPWNAMLFFTGSSYTSWVTGVTGIVTGIWMMMMRLPMMPYTCSSFESATHTG